LIPRAAGYYFSQEITRKFFHANNLKMMCRGQQYVEKVTQIMLRLIHVQGYSLEQCGLVTTICSSPDYLGKMKNVGAVFEIDDSLNMN